MPSFLGKSGFAIEDILENDGEARRVVDIGPTNCLEGVKTLDVDLVVLSSFFMVLCERCFTDRRLEDLVFEPRALPGFRNFGELAFTGEAIAER